MSSFRGYKKIESFGLKTFVTNGHNFKSMNLN